MSNYFQLIRVLFFCLLIICTISCHDDSTSTCPIPPSPSVDLTKVIPLDFGNFWIYRVVTENISGTDTTIDTIRVVDTVSFDGRKHYRYAGGPAFFDPLSGPYIESVDSIEYTRYYDNRMWENSPPSWLPIHLLKAPLTRGQSWRCSDDTSNWWFGILVIVNPDSAIELSYGRFVHAIHLQRGLQIGQDLIIEEEYAIVPNIGIVRQWNGMIDSFTYRELIEWHVQ